MTSGFLSSRHLSQDTCCNFKQVSIAFILLLVFKCAAESPCTCTCSLWGFIQLFPGLLRWLWGNLGWAWRRELWRKLQGPSQVMNIFAFQHITTKCSCLVNIILKMNDLHYFILHNIILWNSVVLHACVSVCTHIFPAEFSLKVPTS